MPNFTNSSLPVPHTAPSFDLQPFFLASIIANIILDFIKELLWVFDNVLTVIAIFLICLSLAASFSDYVFIVSLFLPTPLLLPCDLLPNLAAHEW